MYNNSVTTAMGKVVKNLQKYPDFEMGLFQALVIIIYCFLVGLIFWKGNTWFGKMDFYLGPVLFLVLFILSALICGLTAFAYPIYIFWEEKNTSKALRIIGFTSIWLFVFVLLVMTALIIR